MNIKIKAILLLLLGTIFWGMTFVFIKDAVSQISVANFLGYRFLLAALILGCLFFKRFRSYDWDSLRYGALLAVPLLFSFLAQTIGLQYTTASKGGFITGLSVVFVPLILSFIQKRLPSFNILIAVVLATMGLGFLTLGSSLSLNIGDTWVFMSAIIFAIYIIMVARYSGKSDAILLSVSQFFLVGLVCIIYSGVKGELHIPSGYKVWQAIIFTAIFATAFMYTVQNYYQKYISEITTSIIFSFEPLFAAITAYFYLNEALTERTVIGGLMIFAGILFAEIKMEGKFQKIKEKFTFLKK
ncbi:DMT family transporter [Ancylomarina sp. 16SWW S1-10-2]|uniref:DMT family transporter n=1 Tax=Ancylomarina sp. 16SWW S1-10-2 TaxID=2499681 RepID=UPI0012AE1ED0|nr:DMT family transporter [Ancylomarina sp. 16SWW S1-10-2]MRT94343.1 DMT family transporter [Ancylomarina sp. 16SWW S1-10-2]